MPMTILEEYRHRLSASQIPFETGPGYVDVSIAEADTQSPAYHKMLGRFYKAFAPVYERGASMELLQDHQNHVAVFRVRE